MATPNHDELFSKITEAKIADEDDCLDRLMTQFEISPDERKTICANAIELIRNIRQTSKPVPMDAMLAEYGLGSKEGIALLRLAEALMRIPDNRTKDALIADKLAGPNWESHRGKSSSQFVNSVSQAIDLTSRLINYTHDTSNPDLFKKFMNSTSHIPIRLGVSNAVSLMSKRFVHGTEIEKSIAGLNSTKNKNGHYSFDMLGEAALTEDDALRFFNDYKNAIAKLKPLCTHSDFRENQGISIKLSALHPRYELTQLERVLDELCERVIELSVLARDANMGMNIDAEEADRLELSLMVIEKVLRKTELAGWDGFGIVVQAYGKAAPYVIDWLYALASSLDRKIMIRLVKGAYWDSEIKRAQLEGLPDFPVYTRKSATDVSYLCCAKKLLSMSDRIYPQFAGHNAHTTAAIMCFVSDDKEFEFQRIHGMGEQLHNDILPKHGRICRVYAPVGNKQELLPYLARRILENGANSSFVNQIADLSWNPEDIAKDPFVSLEEARKSNYRPIPLPANIFGNNRINSRGWDIHSLDILEEIQSGRQSFHDHVWNVENSHDSKDSGTKKSIINPANAQDTVGIVCEVSEEDVQVAIQRSQSWHNIPATERSRILVEASNILEQRACEIFAVLAREAGKTLDDSTSELREAVDFLRYYADEALKLGKIQPIGRVVCISPWNFPLAIFIGQCSAALATGNAVLAKPAAQTTITASLAVNCLHSAGVPKETLQLISGSGQSVGNLLTSHPKIDAVAFTGSSETARKVNRALTNSNNRDVRLVAETGGLNAMIVDSTALPEQAIKDIIDSAFRSAGQRCSALRVLYLQSEIAKTFLEMLYGAMRQLKIGDPWFIDTDIGPLIDEASCSKISNHIRQAKVENRLMLQLQAPKKGNFVGPAVIRINGIEDVHEEIFGPVLHVAQFDVSQLDHIVQRINNSGYGLTFGIHTRLDSRVDTITRSIEAGNIYVNRNQIGAVVGSQPFGGEKLSGTGPKAGGPDYLHVFTKPKEFDPKHFVHSTENEVAIEDVQALLYAIGKGPVATGNVVVLPGPTGESNRMYHYSRGTALCLGPGTDNAMKQASIAERHGCQAVIVAEGVSGANAVSGTLPRSALATLQNFDVVALWSDNADISEARKALASRDGFIIPLASGNNLNELCTIDRHVCIDTTAAGGNAMLFASQQH